MAGSPPARSPVSPQRYLARRVLVGVLLGVVLIGLVRVIGGVAGGDGGPVVDDPGAPSTADGANGSAGGTPGPDAEGGGAGDAGGGGGEAADGEALGAAIAAADDIDADADADESANGEASGAGADGGDPGGPPSVDDPARVLIVGDSDAGTFGPYLQELLQASNIVETELDYKVSSGLARPDFFDWHSELEEVVPAVDPDIVVVTFGGNDAQFLADRSGATVVGQATPDTDNADWTAEYRDRVRRVVEYLTSDPDRTVIWVGIPNHADPDVRFRMQVQDEAVKAELAEWPEVRFVDSWSRFAGRSGGFAQYVIDPRDGRGKSVRADDGFHLNQVGAEILAIDIAGVVFADLRDRGAAI